MSRPVLVLLVLSAVTFLLGLGRPAITDADEAYYAEAAREMVETGDWLTPHFNYRDRWEKPVLYYWLTAATYRVAGATEWAARLWAALAGIGLAFLTWSIARSATTTIRSFDAAWLAGAIVATSFGYFAEARMALPDLPLAFCVTLAIWAAIRASLDPELLAPRTTWWVVAGLAAGVGFLMKGPVAIAVPALVLLPIWWREAHRLVDLPRGVIIAGSVGAIVGLPWYAAMWIEHGTPYLESFFIGDNVERFATGRFNERRIPGYYAAVLLGGMLPWSAYLIAMLPSVTRWRQWSLSMTAVEWRLVIWAIAPLVFFTVSVGQQPRYILPVLPPVAVLLARALTRRIDDALAGGSVMRLRAATWATAALLLVMAALLARARPLFVLAIPVFFWAGVALVAAAGLTMAAIAWSASWRRLAPAMVGAAAVLLLSVQGSVLSGRRPEPVEEMAVLVASHRVDAEPVGIYRAFVRNLVFYARFPHVELFDDQPAIDFLRSAEPVLLVIDAEDLQRLGPALSGVTVTTLASVRYLNTANIKIGTLLRPDIETDLRSVVLVRNR